MKCKWYVERYYNGECFNGSCPYCGGMCPTSKHPEVCKYAEYTEKQPEIPQLSAKELAKTLRLCGSASCRGCAFSEFSDCGSIILPQAADMLEKLAAEKDEKKPEKKHEAYLCSLDSCLLSGGQYIDDIRVFYDDGKCGERPGHSLDAAPQTAEGGRKP